MNNRPIHENLDTSFVNLSALVKHLCRRRFTGYVRIRLNDYEADIYLTAGNGLKVREHDRLAGRVAHGEEALRRILLRSREPGGIISVYQTPGETKAFEKKERAIDIVEKKVPIAASKPAAAEKTGMNGKPKIEFPVTGQTFQNEPPLREEKPPKPVFSNVPFEFTNKVEERAKQPALSKEDGETLFRLTGELLGAVDRALAAANLDFSAAFRKACTEIAADYPFLDALGYDKGKIYYTEAPPNPRFFVAGVLEGLRRVLDKLARNLKFAEVHRFAVQRVLGLIHQRRALYDKFSITKPLEKILGV